MKFSILILTILILTVPAFSADDLPPVTGNTTNTTVTLTNTTGKKWLLSIMMQGTLSGTNSIVINNGDASYILAYSTTATDSLIYSDGTAGIDWTDNGTLLLTFASNGVTTNFYRLKTKIKQ